ncbi:hypothetical protein [Arcobacter sp. YIC-310]|uniref:hypothetical protein n=1 Tax=Arcobacter sp. YIC-310 TaxID=3376632 RepID=UPI003C26A8E4
MEVEKYSKSIDQLVENVISKHRIQNTIEQINSFGFDFEDMFVKKDYLIKDEEIVTEVEIRYLKDYFLDIVKSKYKVDNIQYTYNNYQIEIEEVSSEDSSISLNSKIKKLQAQAEEWKDLFKKDEYDNEHEDVNFNLSNNYLRHEEEIEQLEQLENKRLSKIAKEIEVTINEQLVFLKKETLDLERELEEKIKEFLETKQIKKGFFNKVSDFFKNAQVERTKSRVVSEYMLNIDNHVDNLKLEKINQNKRIEKHNDLIKVAAKQYDNAPFYKLPQIFMEIRILKNKGKLLKKEVRINREKIDAQITYFRKKYNVIEEEIRLLIDEKYEEILLNQYIDNGADEMYVSERELEHYTIQDYLKIAKKYNID